MKRVIFATLTAGLLTQAAFAQSTIELFEQIYKVQRLDYFDVVWTDNNGATVHLVEAEGAHYVGNNRLLLTTGKGEQYSTTENWIVEVEIPVDAAGFATGISFSQVVIQQDQSPPPPPDWDLHPGGVTVNTGPTGLAANGGLLVGDGEDEDGTPMQIRGYDWTGNQLEWPIGSGCLGTMGGMFCGIDVSAQNAGVEDLAYIPPRDRIFTVEDDFYEVEVFTPDGVYMASESFSITQAGTWGEGKGITFVPNNGNFPPALSVNDGVVIVSLDDQGPALNVFDLDGNEVAFEPLTVDGTPTGAGILERPNCPAALQLESLAADADTGRLFLVNQGDLEQCNYLWVLTPLNVGDLNCDGLINAGDIDPFVLALTDSAGYEAAYPDCNINLADANGDGLINAGDIDPFVSIIVGP